MVLIGGVSNMSAVRRLCAERFPRAKRVPIPAPAETVALGLARWGVIQLRTTAFSTDVQEFCETGVPQVVSAYTAPLQENLAEELAREIVAEVVIPVTREWRRRDHRTLDDMKLAMEARLTSWIQSPACAATIERACAPTLLIISKEMNDRTNEICTRHGIPQGSLQLGVAFRLNETMEVPMSMPFDTAVGIAAAITFPVLIVLTGIAKVALMEATLASGPPGWLVGALMATWAALIGLPFLDDKLKAADIPCVVRRRVLSDRRLNRLMKDLQPKLKIGLQTAIGGDGMSKIQGICLPYKTYSHNNVTA